MKTIFYIFIFLLNLTVLNTTLSAQLCNTLTATCKGYESRCAATGSIKVNASGGSGFYKYKAVGPVTTNFTSSDSITGLPSGTYTVVTNDIQTNCEYITTNVIVTGNYQDARFDLSKIDVSCDNGNNGSITVINQQYGRAPYTYAIVAPSPMGVGTTNSTGVFNNLIAGDYGIRMMDSCGGVQTRRIMVNNYSWWIDSYLFTKQSCTLASGFIKVIDSKGNVSTGSGIPGFTYGIVKNVGDTTWSNNANFSFTIANEKVFEIVVKDNCGNIKKASTSLTFTPAISNTVSLTGITCNSFTASLTGITNYFSPNYCLFNSADVQVACNTTGVFTNIPFGSYCIKAKDGCTDTTITRCFTQAAPPLSVGNTVALSNRTCTSFTATINTQVGLTNPNYCIYPNNSTTALTCNSTGVFSNLSYGSYCIKIVDGCRDTTITRCFTAVRPRPTIASTISPLYTTCSNFGISIGGDSLTNPQYCLFNSSGVQIVCNTTGIFDSLPYGNYCVNVYDPCIDTTIIRCFTTVAPVVTNSVVLAYTNRTCSSFTLTATSSLTSPTYNLYTSSNTLYASNTTGVFTNLPYGTYCLNSRNACPDTTMINCFTQTRPIPSVSNTLTYSNLRCASFDVRVTGQTNLTSPNYCLFDNNNVQLSCNTTGSFTNVPYGSYCIRIINTCYDTTIVRCFTRNPTPFDMQANAYKSCTYGYAYFDFRFIGGTLPVNVKIYRPNGNLLMSRNYSSTSFTQDSIPGIASTETYKLVAEDMCGNKDSLNIGVTASYFTRIPVVINKCPSATASTGSGDIRVTASTNMGTIQVRLRSRNGVNYSPSLSPNSTVGNVYTFNDLSPATYVIRYREDNCNITIYDTVVVGNYIYPNLSKSSAYQCDVNGFSVGAVASGGVAPFTYEIIGSAPVAPSIVSAPQASPIFAINNGSSYSLIRLRAIDACGNGTLNDASIMPLSNMYIKASLNCFAGPTTLTVDTMYNSTYTWYKKVNMAAIDSVHVGTGPSYFIPSLSPLDTGIYVCKAIVNSGCITKIDYINIDGDCTRILPTQLKDFTGKMSNNIIDLAWVTTQENNLNNFIIEKQINNSFVKIGTKKAVGNTSTETTYSFADTKPNAGSNIYRLRLEDINGATQYSKVINVKNIANTGFSIFPNPVDKFFNISFYNQSSKNVDVYLQNNIGQTVYSNTFNNITNKISINKPANVLPGIYMVKIIDKTNGDTFLERIIIQ